MSRFTLHQGDSRELLKALGEASVDSIVCDPPYHLTNRGGGPHGKGADNPYSRSRAGAASSGFMGMTWDGGDVAHDPAFWAECLRVAKPGAWLLAFGGTRTYHRLACAIEDAGWELRDSPVRGHMHQPEDCPWLHGWMFGSGFPKSHNGEWGGTALKPAWEPIVCARKPLIGTVEDNWREHGTGGLDIDGCRIEGVKDVPASPRRAPQGAAYGDLSNDPGTGGGFDPNLGRWPANLLHDGSPEVVSAFPSESSVTGKRSERSQTAEVPGTNWLSSNHKSTEYTDSGSAARFFYCAKASQEDRNEGCFGLPEKVGGMVSNTSGQHITRRDGGAPGPRANHHPTVKPTELMRWLVRLVTPPDGLVLDPFMGSGSTGKAAMLEGFRFVGIDLTPEYVEIARARIEFALRQGHQPSLLELSEDA